MKTLSGILIDPFKKEITYHTFKYDGYSDLYPVLDCKLFDVVTLSRGDKGDLVIMFVDDEGLYREDQTFFTLNFMGAMPFAGKALIVTENAEGNLESIRESIVYNLKMAVTWLGDSEGLEEAIQKGEIERPYSAFGTFDMTEDGPTEPKNMTKTWEWTPPARPAKKEGV